MTRPNFCPHCGEPFPQGEEEIGGPAILTGGSGLGEFTFLDLEGGYDCYCKQCKWTGDILPDDEHKDFEYKEDE